jgi:hypothetical protein
MTDPFGLNPLGNQLNIDWSQIGHTILDVVGIFCDAADNCHDSSAMII